MNKEELRQNFIKNYGFQTQGAGFKFRNKNI